MARDFVPTRNVFRTVDVSSLSETVLKVSSLSETVLDGSSLSTTVLKNWSEVFLLEGQSTIFERL